MGIASGIGIIKVFSIFCCLWFIFIGGIATWIAIRQLAIKHFDGTIEKRGVITVADGAMTGVITGFPAGIIALLSDFIIRSLSSVIFWEMTISYAILGYPILGTIFSAIGGIIIAKVRE